MTSSPRPEGPPRAEPPEDRRRRPPPPLPGSPRLRSALLDQGLGDVSLRHAVRAGAAERLVRGLYVGGQVLSPSSAPPDLTRPPSPGLTPAEVLTLRGLTADAVHAASHRTAALLHGIPMPPSDGGGSGELHLTRTDGRKALRRRGDVISHRAEVPRGQLTCVEGILVTTPARTWADLAGQHSLLELLIMADQLLRAPRHEFGEEGQALVLPQELTEVVAARRGARGIRRAREAAALARVGVDSVRETQLRFALHQAGLPEMEVNPRLPHQEGGRTRVYQPDLFLREAMLGIQYEGRHHSDPAQVERDVSRAELAEEMGILEVRITDRHSRPEWRPAVAKVSRALRGRGRLRT